MSDYSATPMYVTAGQIAAVAGLTEKHVRRVISRTEGWPRHLSPTWRGVHLDVHDVGGENVVLFCTLPEHIRDAFVMKSQLKLPLFSDTAEEMTI